MSVTQSDVDELRADMHRDLAKHATLLGPVGLIREDIDELFDAIGAVAIRLAHVKPIAFVYVLTGWITMMRRMAGAKKGKT